MSAVPEKLQALLDLLADITDPSERATVLLGFADEFREVPPAVAVRPFPRNHQIPQCESDAYAWAMRRPDGTLRLYFAVENPSGVSAKALAVILDKTLSGLPPAEVAGVSPDIVERIFRQNLSMGKGLGLMSMVLAVQALARRALDAP